MKFDAAAKNSRIVITVYGKDSGKITVSFGSEILKTIDLQGNGNDELLDISIDIPKKLVKPKQKGAKVMRENVTVTGSAGARLIEIRAVNK